MGAALLRHLGQSHEMAIVTRNPKAPSHVKWDGKTLGEWTTTLEGVDAVINLAGRRVHCRYNADNLREMMDSRIDSTRVLGDAIAQCSNPPRVWLQASTATIYAHTFGPANDELTGVLGGSEPGVPETWNYSIQIAKAWEAELERADTPKTRKVALRTAIMMGIDRDSAFDIFSRLARVGLGGTLGGGQQYVSWIHEVDLARAFEFLIERDELCGPVNVCAPEPLPQRDFAQALRRAWGVPVGLPAARWMVALGALFLNGDSELVLKSRRVEPTRLLDAGFSFRFPTWPEASRDLVERMQGLPAQVAADSP
jgi:uncharacterized protein (TIGR01777 family)